MVTPATPPVPHVGGPITGPGATRTLIAGLPAAVVGDLAACVGPPDSIVVGSFVALIEGRPSVRIGDQCAHGGAVASGCPTVFIGNAGGAGSPQAGTMSAAKASGAMFTQTNCGLPGAEEAPPPPEPEAGDWIEIELVDEEGEPIANQLYHIETEAGQIYAGHTDARGVARVEGLRPGQCRVSFPALDGGTWRPL
jgi:uncharacterized Zn-binding protein involved in type VI secretion